MKERTANGGAGGGGYAHPNLCRTLKQANGLEFNQHVSFFQSFNPKNDVVKFAYGKGHLVTIPETGSPGRALLQQSTRYGGRTNMMLPTKAYM